MNVTALPIFDTHAHLDLEPFCDDLHDVIHRLEQGQFPDGITLPELEARTISMAGVLLPGIDVASSRSCIAIARQSPLLCAAVALHPNSGDRFSEANWKTIEQLACLDDVCAVGETGLDLYWDKTSLDVQKDYFQRHLELARSVDKPVLIHCRDAWDEMLPILRRHEGVRGVIHAFSGTPQQAEESLRLGHMVSFAGSLTYRNAKFSPLWEAAKIIPADRLLIETDSPYMAPHPFRGKLRRNEPLFAVSVAIRLAGLRDESLEFLCEKTTQNARQLFQNRRSTSG